MNDKKLANPESFGPIGTVGQGIAALSKLANETMLSVRDMQSLPPKLVIDIYKIACLAKSIDDSVGASKSTNGE